MAKKVKIATLGPSRLTTGGEQSPEALVKKAMAHWQSQFDLVLPDRPDLVVVPEACDEYEDMAQAQLRGYLACRGTQVLDLFARVAKQHRCYVVYSSYIAMPDGSLRNASLVLNRSGELAGRYHKNHVVVEERTRLGTLYGREAAIIECDFGRIACAICFDLNFDRLRLHHAAARPDLIVFQSMYHGGLADIRNPFGEVLYSSTNYRPYAVGEVNLDCCMAHLDRNWDKLRRLKERFGPSVDIHDPGFVGSVLITSLSDTATARDMAAEMEIELLDDYLARSLADRGAAGNIEPELP